jgi:hypothetical protein
MNRGFPGNFADNGPGTVSRALRTGCRPVTAWRRRCAGIQACGKVLENL